MFYSHPPGILSAFLVSILVLGLTMFLRFASLPLYSESFGFKTYKGKLEWVIITENQPGVSIKM